MAGYVKLFRAIWQDADFKALSAEDQRTYTMLISQNDISHVGVLPLMPSRWARNAADTTPDSIRASIARLAARDFVLIDEETEELLVRTYLVHDEAYRLTNGKTSLRTAYARVLSPSLQAVIHGVLATVDVTVELTVVPTVEVSQQPAAAAIPIPVSHEPAAAASTATDAADGPDDPDDDGIVDVAAAALLLLIDHKMVADAPRKPGAYRRALERDLPDEHGAFIGRYIARHPTCSALDLAYAIGLPRPAEEPPPEPEWHYDPACFEHGADGWVTMPDGGAGTPVRCACAQREPYPEPPHAAVIQLYKGGAA